MLDKDAIKRKFANIITNASTTLTYNGNDYNGSKTNNLTKIIYTEQGEEESYDFSIRLNTADFATIPSNQEKVTIDGITHRIIDSDLDSLGITITLHLGNEYPRS